MIRWRNEHLGEMRPDHFIGHAEVTGDIVRIGDTEFTRVIREDPERRGLLYAGTETGVYVSRDAGGTGTREKTSCRRSVSARSWSFSRARLTSSPAARTRATC